ncbi:MAG: cell division protein ZapA [Gammaproteobacteria bacterium]
MNALQIHIRRHRFDIACEKRDETAMRAAARRVEEQLRAVRENSKVADGERAALMVALQIAFEAGGGETSETSKTSEKLGGMLRRIDGALQRTESSLQERAPAARTNDT